MNKLFGCVIFILHKQQSTSGGFGRPLTTTEQRNEQTTSKAAGAGNRLLNVWIDDILDRLVTSSSTGKHSTLKQKTTTQQQRKRVAVSMSRYTGSLTGCLLCVKG